MMGMLVLGTAQFGSDYGVVNARGKVPASEVTEILRLARQAGVDRIDTAPVYGGAENVLNRSGVEGFKIITKVPKLHDSRHANRREAVVESERQSCENLGCKKLHGLLLHSAADLNGEDGDEIYAGLLAARDAGLVEHVGVSIYAADEIEMILDRYPVDIVQLPLSVLDQRLRPWLPRLTERGIATHVRSVFLQGLLLCPIDKLPRRLARLGPAIEVFRDRATLCGLQTIEAAIAFVRDLPSVKGIVVGTASVDEFRALLNAAATKSSFNAEGLAVNNVDLVDPRCWVLA
jgi:hypothetical protein